MNQTLLIALIFAGFFVVMLVIGTALGGGEQRWGKPSYGHTPRWFDTLMGVLMIVFSVVVIYGVLALGIYWLIWRR